MRWCACNSIYVSLNNIHIFVDSISSYFRPPPTPNGPGQHKIIYQRKCVLPYLLVRRQSDDRHGQTVLIKTKWTKKDKTFCLFRILLLALGSWNETVRKWASEREKRGRERESLWLWTTKYVVSRYPAATVAVAVVCRFLDSPTTMR